MKSGQILIIVLLIVVVTLAVGLSVASRNITNLRTSTQTEQSQRVFAAAEGGVEDVLGKLSKVATDISVGSGTNSGCTISGPQATCSVPVGNITATVNVLANVTYQTTLNTGEIGQIDLKNAYTNGVRTVNVEWARNSADETNPAASVEITFVCQTVPCVGSSSSFPSGYAQQRFAFTISSPPGEAGFSACGSSLSGVYASFIQSDPLCKVSFTLPNNNVLSVRVRPFWQKATVKVSSGTAGVNLPVQIYEVNSLAATDVGLTRRVKVTRTALPALPAAFDYALFSEGTIAK